MSVYEIDPQKDSRWNTLVQSDPRSSVFHTPEWLEALHQTYGYTARVFTTSSEIMPLVNGIVFCTVNSWLTGPRLVSLPFSDHCEPLVCNTEDLRVLLMNVEERSAGKFRYAEIRPRSIEPGSQSQFPNHDRFYLHVLDLRPSIEELYSRLHKDSVQRKIRRAERDHVELDQGHSEPLLRQFYELLLLTRRRHQLPPQPFTWFHNLAECFGTRLIIYVARLNNQPIASILTLRHKKSVVYKYGCSDIRFHNVGGMAFLFWQAIREAKAEQLEEFDLGRSEPEATGLIRFKDNLGARKTSLNYWRVFSKPNRARVNVPQFRLAQRFLSHLPDSMFRLAGELFYRHAG
jgi:hypothetical protein